MKENVMDAIQCAAEGCTNVGVPSTMYARACDYAPDAGTSYEPICVSCAVRLDAEAVAAAPAAWKDHAERCEPWLDMVDGGEPDPTPSDLRDWVETEGASCEAFAADCFEQWSPTPVMTSVPYGDTFAHWQDGPGFEDCPASITEDVAQRWWEDGKLGWVLDDEVERPWRVFLRDTLDGLGQAHMTDRGWTPGNGDVLVDTFATRDEVEARMALLANPTAGTYVGNLMRDGLTAAEAVQRVYRVERAPRTMSLRVVNAQVPA